MRSRAICAGISALALTATASTLLADTLSDLPGSWRRELVPIPEADVSGAERLMQEAIADARRDAAELLSAPEPDKAALARALAADQGISPARLLELIARLRAGEAEAEIAMASWLAPPSEREAMNRELASYAKGEVPAQP